MSVRRVIAVAAASVAVMVLTAAALWKSLHEDKENACLAEVKA